MKKYRADGFAVLVLLMMLFCCGCVELLPPGTPPEGNIVDNPVPQQLTEAETVLALSSRLAASAMEHFPGGAVAVDADNDSAVIAKAAVAEAGKICGIHLELAAAPVLTVRKKNSTVEAELFLFSRSLWRCSFELKDK
ncbi:MAG: hypothetical protein IKA87_07805 [Lentisphaeria bacterium]|nr:hypothetical protein [Lentisphaeria bacterium]